MKFNKIVALALALVMVFALCACGGGNTDTKTDDTGSASKVDTNTVSVGAIVIARFQECWWYVKLPEWASDDTGILRPEERCRRYDQEDSWQGRTDRPSGEEDEERDQTIICSGNVF